jgi:signal transduction histidine kinase
MDKAGGYMDRDLYVVVLDKQGVFKMHSAKPSLNGRSGLDMKDPDGKEFMKDIVKVKGTGWVNFKWPDPLDNNKPKDKALYVIETGDVYVTVGYYKI